MLDMQPQLARPNGPNGAHPIPARRRKRAKPPVDRAPALVGWLSSDAEEIERRRWRGRTEIGQIEPLERDLPHFGSFRVRSAGGSVYDVEIRSLDQPLNSCGCADHRVNGLGTCKHIEGVLAKLRQRGVRAFTAAQRAGSPRVELFLPRTGDPVPRLLWPADPATVDAARAALAPFVAADGSLADASPDRIDALLRSVADAGPLVRQQLRVSRHLEPWLADARRRAARIEARARFEAEVEAGTQTIDLLHHPLLPYQREGMLHLAFGERALLADDMGLGKTIQAIAATRTAAPAARGRSRAGGLPGVAERRMAGADRALQRRDHAAGHRQPAGTARAVRAARLLHRGELRAGRHRRRRHQPARCGRTSSSSTRRSGSRTGTPRRRAR